MTEIEDLRGQIAALRTQIQATPQNVTPQGAAQQVAMPQIPLPAPLNIREGDISENCKYFKQQWKNYITATGLTSQSEERIKAVLLSAIGEDVFRRYTNMPIENEDTLTATSLLEEIEKNLTPTINKRYIRAVFNMAKQEQDETYDEYFNRLRGLIKNAQYGELEKDLLLDKIICSIKDHELREKLWLNSDITLEKAIETCRSKEITEKQIRGIENSQGEVNKIQKVKKGKINQQQSRTSERGTCKFCGADYHDNLEQCRARTSICNKCNKRGHYARVCLSKPYNNYSKPNRNSRTVKELVPTLDNDDETSDSGEEFVLNTFENDNSKGLYVKLNFYNNNNKSISTKCQLDTGATCNIIGRKNLIELESSPYTTKTKTKLTTIEGAQITPVGKTQLKIEIEGN